MVGGANKGMEARIPESNQPDSAYAAFHLPWKSEVGAVNTCVDRVPGTTSRKTKTDASRKTFVVLGFFLARLAIGSNTS